MKPTITKEQLEEIRQRVEAVEGDRWFVSDRTDVSYEYPPGSCEVHSVCMTSGTVYADFIANARQDIPALLDHIAELEAELAENKISFLSYEESQKDLARRCAERGVTKGYPLYDYCEEGDEDDNV